MTSSRRPFPSEGPLWGMGRALCGEVCSLVATWYPAGAGLAEEETGPWPPQSRLSAVTPVGSGRLIPI